MPLSHGASDQTLPGLKPLLFLSGSLLGVVVVVVVVSLCSLPPLSFVPLSTTEMALLCGNGLFHDGLMQCGYIQLSNRF